MAKDNDKRLPWSQDIVDDASKLAAQFQEMMQRPVTHKTLIGAFKGLSVLFIALFPLLLTMAINLSVCQSNLGGAFDEDELISVCAAAEAAEAALQKEDTTGDTTTDPISTYRIETLDILDGLSPSSAEGAIERLDALEKIMSAQKADEAARAEKVKSDNQTQVASEYQHYRLLVIFMALGAAYAVWAIATLIAQTWVANRIWVARERAKDAIWRVSDVVWAAPLIATLLFSVALATLLFVIDFEQFFDLPGTFGANHSPNPFIWISVATLTVATTFVTAIATQRLACDYPDPTHAHSIRIKLHHLRRRMIKFAKDQKTGDGPHKHLDWPEKVTHIEVLALGCSDASKGLPPKGRPYQFGGIEPKVTKTIKAEANVETVKRLCVILIAIKVATLILISLGIDVLEGQLSAKGDLKEAIVLSGNAWIMVLGVGMSVSVFLIYAPALSRLLPYAAEADAKPKSKTKGWSLSGRAALLPSEDDSLSLEAKPIEDEKKEDIIDRHMAYILGGNQAKLQSIIDGCLNGGGFQAAFDEGIIKRIVSLVGLLAPAAAGTLLTFL